MGAVTRWFCLTKASVSAGTRRIVLAVSTLVLGMLAFAAPASATTETFNYTGAAQTWTVPAGVTRGDLRPLRGAGSWRRVRSPRSPGTRRPGDGDDRGHRRRLDPGQRRRPGVGTDVGGFNGGGASGTVGIGGWGGGGASDIRVGGTALTDRVLVAGGGGGLRALFL